MLDKRLQTVLLDLFLSVKAEHLFNLKLYRKSVCIPSCLSRYHISLHGTVTRDHILDYAGKHMADMGLSVCCRRAVIEYIGLSFSSALNTLFKDLLILPEFLYFFFSADKIQVG